MAVNYALRIRNAMKRLGTYRPEYENAIGILAQLQRQYDTLTERYEREGMRFEVETSMGSKKAPIVTTLESLRKDVLAYATGGRFWALNEKTRMKLCAEALTFNAAGAIVSGVQDTMPVVGGAIETLEFIPDDVVFCGYEGLYLLCERAGTALAVSEHVRFTEDQTVFKGTARYDGTPVIPEGFVVMGIGGSKPVATAVTFRKDEANEVQAESSAS